MVALATLVTLVAFLWPLCKSALGYDEPAAILLTDADRQQLVAAAIARMELDARAAAAEAGDLTAAQDVEEPLDGAAAVIETIASADGLGQAYRVDTDLVIEALQQVSLGNRGKAVALLHEIARQQEEAGARLEAAETFGRIAQLHNRRDTAAQLVALQRVADLNPSHAFNWYSIATTARTLGKADLCKQAILRGMEVARENGNLMLAFMFPGKLAEVHRDAGDFELAIDMWWAAADLARSTAAESPDERSVIWNASFVLADAAQSALQWGTDQGELAVAAAEEAARLWTDFEQRHPEEFNEVEFADSLISLASVQRLTEDLEAAEDSVRRAIDVHQSAVDAAPDDPHLVGHLLSGLVVAARIFLDRGMLEEGREAQESAMTHARFLWALNPNDPSRHRSVAVLSDLAGQLAAASGDHEAAVAHLESARETMAEVHAGAPWNSNWSDDFLACQIHLFAANLARGNDDEARRTGAEAEAFAQRLEDAGVLGPRRVAEVTRLRTALSKLNPAD